MSGYENAIQTRMLATHCVSCGRPLVDAISVERGMGPCCRAKADNENTYAPLDDRGLVDQTWNAARQAANKIVYQAACFAQTGHVQNVLECAEQIEELGFPRLAALVARRFKQMDTGRLAPVSITIREVGDLLYIQTPFRRGDKDAFIAAWRDIPGRRFDRNTNENIVPASSKALVWLVLQRFFAGKHGVGPKGRFRVTEKV